MFSFSRIIHACVRQVGQTGPDSGHEKSQSQMQGAATAASRLPSYEIGVSLSDSYFENVHLQYPFLHEPSFRQWEQNALGRGSWEATSGELFFVHMVYAISALLKSNSGSLPGQLYAGALQYIDHVLARKNLESIQAVLSCAMYSLRASTGPSIWNLSGLALRQCIELGYHRDVKKINVSTNILRSELRKRAFWCAYQMDCVSSINLGLPLGLPIHKLDTELPLDVNDSALSEEGIDGLPRQSSSDPVTTTSHALHQFRLRCIWARIYQTLYNNSATENQDNDGCQAQVRTLRAQLDDWMASTPPEPRRSGAPLTVFSSLENYRVDYSETILLLYRGQLTTEATPSSEIYQECIQAAVNICQSCKRLYLGRPINYTWSTLHVLFQAGLTYLHCLWASPSVRQNVRYDSVSSTFTTCIMLLAIMAERWDGAAPYRDLFEALSSRAMAMIVEQNHGSEDQSALPMPSDFDSQPNNPNMEDLAQWASDITDVGMPDTFDTLLCGLIGDFFGSEAQAFYNDSSGF